MADEERRGEHSDVDMFDGLGVKSPDAAPRSNAPPPAPATAPPPGAGAHVLGRPRAPAKTLLGIPGPAVPTAKPVLGTARPSTKLRAAGETKPLPPPPPRRGSLPNIEAARAVPVPPDSGSDLAETISPDRPASASKVAAAAAALLAVDDAAETLIYGKPPVDPNAPLPPEPEAEREREPATRRTASADESAQHLEMPQERASERVSIDEVLAAAPTGPPPPSSRGGLPVGPPSALARAAAAVPEPPAPPPRAAGSLRVPAATAPRASVSGPAAPVATPPPPAPAPAPAPARAAETRGPSRRNVVTTKLPRDKENETKGTPMPLLLAAVAAVAGATAFLLMSRTSTLVVNLADASGAVVSRADVFVDGAKRCSDAPCVVRDVAAGSHEVKVVAAGYAVPSPRTIIVDGRRDVLADFQLAPAPGGDGKRTGFKVTGSPGIHLAVDGQDAGTLPIDKEDLSPGEHKLRFAGDRYVPLDRTIRVAAGEVVDLGAVPLKVAKGRAVLELLTPGATVNLVGPNARKEVTQLPIAIELAPSEKWEVVATKEGYADFREPISFDDGQAEKTISIALGAAVKTSASASTSTNSNPTPSGSGRPAPPRTVPPPRPDSARNVDKPPADPDAETVLKINSLPASSIMLDGKAIGVTPQPHVVVTPGSHTVTFVNSELSLKKTITVDVKAGESKAAFARLRDGDE